MELKQKKILAYSFFGITVFIFIKTIIQIQMKKFILLLLITASTFVFAQSEERLSVHFFDVPQELESQFLKFNSLINKELENAGFGKNFYKIYKVKEGDESQMFRYFQISSYTSDKHYEMTHNNVGEKYDKILDEFWESDLGKKVFTFNEKHIYRKVYRINN